jgi:hypothetical protein
MVLGLILLILGVLAIIAAVGTVDGSTELLGVGISDLTLFLIGVGSGVAILFGLSLTKWGTKRSLRQRRESKRLEELSDKLDKQESDRHHHHDDGDGAERSF